MDTKEPKWGQAYEEELDHLKQTRGTGKDNLVGLAFSGGGIRSATFNLGVLEALRDLDLLKKIDYLSTVSGGGYIGAWFTGNCHRNPDWQCKGGADWTESIRHLRRYSNYLSPIVGFFSADTWSMAMIWIRNTMLVQLTVILAIAAVVIFPRLVFPVFPHWHEVGNWRWLTVSLFVCGVVGIAGNQYRVSRRKENSFILQSGKWRKGLLLGSASLIFAAVLAAWLQFNPFPQGIRFEAVDPGVAFLIASLLVLGGFFLLPCGAKLLRAEEINYSQSWVQGAVVAPMLLVGLLVAAVMWGEVQTGSKLLKFVTFGKLFANAWRYWPFPLMVVFASLALLAFCSVRTVKTPFGVLAVVLAPMASILALHALLCALVMLLQHWQPMGPEGQWKAFVWAPVAVLYAFSLAIIVLIGMLGRQSTEGSREWWSRFGAWLGIYGLAWTAVSLASIYGPHLLATLFTWKYTASATWIGSTLAGLFAGSSSATGGKETKKSIPKLAMEAVAKLAPFIFIAGLVVAVSSLLHQIINLNATGQAQTNYWRQLELQDQNYNVVWALTIGSLALLILLASRVDINEFSLNAFYRSRLVRCYLGATRPPENRNPQRFTNFDDEDDIPLAELSRGPLHIVNCALNLGGSTDLSVHTRRSANFTLSQLHCGSRYLSRATPNGKLEEIGYLPTSQYGGPDGQPSLGQVISVSGAAASPNMGYHTSAVVAFLLTLFNVRLGWWFSKPRPGKADSPSPWFSLRYLFMELFGLANDRSDFLAISDGGHFENLATYELVKRRCKVIIVGDAECDPDLSFGSLGSLIRMCEVDFNAKIKIEVGSIAKGSAEWSHSRCAVGRIQYEGDPADAPSGIFIYLKASMNGHEGTSVQQYKASHPTFPHETTGDQFYGEDQFESYRLLGKDIATATFQPAELEQDMIKLAERLEKVWSPTLRQVSQFTQNSTRLMEIWKEIAQRSDLDFLDPQLASRWPDTATPKFRNGFYVGVQLLQLMENVYLDLRLEETWEHADNQGWNQLFLVWSRADVVKAAWQHTGNTYGLRFQYFCERRLKLPLPE